MRTPEEEYEICKVRGHISDGITITDTWRTKQRCKFCFTYYWTETVTTTHESNTPAERAEIAEQMVENMLSVPGGASSGGQRS